MESLLQDVRYAARMLVKNPGFTAVAVLALALGIGANTAIFTVVNAVLIRSLPYTDPDSVMAINKIAEKGGFPGIAAYEYLDWQEQSEVFENVAAYTNDTFNLSGDEPERIAVARVTANFFPLLGIQPLAGRAFLAEEDQPDRNQVVVVSEAFWQRRFASDPYLGDKTLTLNDKTYTVVGVMPASFRFPPAFDVWMPLALNVNTERHGERWTLINIIARLKPGATIERAQSDLETIAARTRQQYPDRQSAARLAVVPLHDTLVGDVRLALLVLLAAVSFVLLIACANVANLLLSRGAARQKEIAIRVAVGASRWRVIRQLLTESILLALVSGALAILLALWGVDLLVSSIPGDLAAFIHSTNDISVDLQVLGFTLLISLVTGIIFGLAPALVASKPTLNETLKEGGRSSTMRAGLMSLRGMLIVSELALALVLLVGAGLMIKSFVRLLDVKPGFNPENVLTLRIALPAKRYSKPGQKSEFFEQALERIKGLAGVESAGAINHLPLSGFGLISYFTIEGSPPLEPGKDPHIPVGLVSPDYFRALAIPLVKGRFFTDRDREGAPHAVIVNESFARRFYASEDPLGKRIGFACKDGDLCRAIVGVVGDIRQEGLMTASRPEIYLPYNQMPSGNMMIALRTTVDPMSLVGALRSQVLAIDKDQPISHIKTLEQHLSDSVIQPRFIMALLGIFAALALVLAAVGLYGVISYSVNQRAHEIGIRMALGAQAADILGLIMKQAMALVFAGIIIGAGAALAVTRVIESLLYGVSATDQLTFAAVSVVLMAVALVACYIPARRAMKVDPIIALRYE